MNDASLSTASTKASLDGETPSLTLHSALSEVEADWRTLERSPRVSFHQGFDWCSTWMRTHRSQTVIVRARLGTIPLLILPLELSASPLVRTLRFIGSDHSNINTGLFHDDFEALVPEGFKAAFDEPLRRLLRPLADLAVLEKVPFSWERSKNPLAELPFVRNQNASYQLRLHADFDETLSQLNAKRRRKKFKTSERRIEAIGGYEHVIARTHEDRHALLDTFFQQKAARFASQGLPDVFTDPETRAFLHALAQADQPSPDTLLELHAIRLKGEQAGRVMAVSGLSRTGGHVICQFGSIDDTIGADASPGELLFFLMIRRACAEGATVFDFGIGDQAYKRSWCNIETPQNDILLALTARGHIAALRHRASARLKSLIKKTPLAYSLAQRLRRGRAGTSISQGADEV